MDEGERPMTGRDDGGAAKPMIFVAALPRSGTSLVMQMLHAAGVRCVGDWPDFEDEGWFDRAIPKRFIANRRGYACKWLSPHASLGVEPGAPPFVVIWLDRDPVEQAKSQLKFMKATFATLGLLADDATAISVMAASYAGERAECLAKIGPAPRLDVSFEQMVGDPVVACRNAVTFLRQWGFDLDATTMARQVRPRGTACLPGMLETALLSARQSDKEKP